MITGYCGRLQRAGVPTRILESLGFQHDVEWHRFMQLTKLSAAILNEIDKTWQPLAYSVSRVGSKRNAQGEDEAAE